MKKPLILFLLCTVTFPAFSQQCNINKPEYTYRMEESPDYGKSFTTYYFAHVKINSNLAFLSPIYTLTYINTTNNMYQDIFAAESIVDDFVKVVKPQIPGEYQYMLRMGTSSSRGIEVKTCNELDALKKKRAEWMRGYQQSTEQVTVLDDFKPAPYNYDNGKKTARHRLVQ